MSAVARLLAFFGQYSDLKANLNFLSLQSQLERAENRIAFARRDYIEANRQPLKGNVPMPRWHGSWSRALNRRCRDCELAPKCDPIGLPSCGQAGMVSGPVGIGGFEKGEFEGDSAAVEVAAQIRLRGADPVQLGTTGPGYSQAFKSLNSFPVGYQEASLTLIATGVPRRREARRPARSSSVAPFGNTKDSARSAKSAVTLLECGSSWILCTGLLQ